MSKGNTKIREALEKIYGKKCMLHEGLNIRGYSKSKTNYKGKSIEMQLTLHHIKPKSKGGATSVENGAILCRGCHDFVEQTSPENRARINDMLKKYKECIVEYRDDFTTGVELDLAEIELANRELKARKLKYDRAKEKEEVRKARNEYERDNYTN